MQNGSDRLTRSPFSALLPLDRTRPTAGPPPIPFLDALNAANLAPDLRAAIDDLVDRKKVAEEIDEGPAVPVINQLIDTELARLPAIANTMPEVRGQLSDLDTFLHDIRSEM